MITLKLTSVVRSGDPEQVEIHFDWNGNSYEYTFESQAELETVAADHVETLADCAKIIATAWKRENPELDDDEAIVDVDLRVNPGTDAGIQVALGPHPRLVWTRPLL